MLHSQKIFWLSVLTALLLISMFVISLITGVNQQYIETVHALADYERALMHGDHLLRVILIIDGLFIACYWLLGIFLMLALWNDGTKFLLAISTACISGTALLDVVENSTFMMFIESLTNNLSLEAESVQQLTVISSVKWYLAYFAFLFLGLSFPDESKSQRIVSFLMKFVLLPLGLLVFMIPASPALLIAHLLRFGVLIVVLFMLASVAKQWEQKAATK